MLKMADDSNASRCPGSCRWRDPERAGQYAVSFHHCRMALSVRAGAIVRSRLAMGLRGAASEVSDSTSKAEPAQSPFH